ncbi:MAG: metallophosphoesterase [Bacteroidales bacterium]|nr:metallophosphoesterase [Bacteroidales bacterium]
MTNKIRRKHSIRHNFERLLDHLATQTFDCLVISGDLAFQFGKEDIYEFIRNQLHKFKQQILIMAGNHDSVPLLKTVFKCDSESETELYYSEYIKYDEILFVDTSTNTISNTQLDWIKQKIELNQNRLIIFSHHPVLKSGVNYMDFNHPMKNADDLLSILRNYKNQVYFFCGHFHSDTTTVDKNIIQFLCPSNFYLIDPNANAFQKEQSGAAYRTIEIYSDKIITRVKYL